MIAFYNFTPLLLLLILCGCNKAEKHADTISESEVLKFIAAYDTAWNSKDNPAVERLLSGEYIYFSSMGETKRKKESLEFLKDTAYVIHKATRDELEIIIRGNVATVSSHWVGDLSWKGQAIHDNQRCGLTIAKIDGVVQLVAEHCVQIAKK